MDKSEALALLAALQVSFRATPPDDLAIDLYCHRLERYRQEDAERAVSLMIDQREEPMFPTWAEIRRYVQLEAGRREDRERHELEEIEDATWSEAELAVNRERIRALRRALLRDVSQETDT